MSHFSRKHWVLILDFGVMLTSIGLSAGKDDSEGNSRFSVYFPEGPVYIFCVAAAFVGFILFTNMAILNLVTAIIVENVMDISRDVQMDEL